MQHIRTIRQQRTSHFVKGNVHIPQKYICLVCQYFSPALVLTRRVKKGVISICKLKDRQHRDRNWEVQVGSPDKIFDKKMSICLQKV